MAPVRRRHTPETVLIIDGTLVPTRDRTVAAPSYVLHPHVKAGESYYDARETQPDATSAN